MTLPPGTFTLYNNFENCPHKAWHIYILKAVPYVETPEMKWGNEVHKAMENRLKNGTCLPGNMLQAEPIAHQLWDLKQNFPIRVEAQLAIDKSGSPIDYWAKGDPAHNGVFLRGKLDFVMVAKAAASAWMLDWKTGKVREEPFELEVGALLVKAHMPEIEQITGNYYWMQTGQKGVTYNLNDHVRTWERIQKLRAEMEGYAALGEWPKRKNPLCGWCGVLSCENNTSHRRK